VLQADLNTIGQTLNASNPTAGAPIESTLNSQITSVQGSASQLSSAITAVNAAVGGSGGGVFANVTALNSTLGGTGSATTRTSAIHNAILTSPGATVTGDLATLEASLVTTPSGILATDVGRLNTLIDGTGGGSTVQARIGAPTVNGTASNLAAVIGTGGTNLAAKLGDPGIGFPNIASMIGTSGAASLTGALGNSGAGRSSINVLLGAGAPSLYGEIVGSSGILDSIDGTTTDSGNIPEKLNTETGLVENGATQLSSAIADVNSALGSGQSLTPDGDLFGILTAPNSGTTSGLISMISGSNSGTLLGGINSVAAQLDGSLSVTGTTGDSVTGKIGTQIGNVENNGTQLSTAVNDVGSLIGGSGPLATQIGNPVLNGSASNLVAVIGGSGATIAAQLGDPVAGDEGLSALIDASGASDGGGVFLNGAVANFTNSTSLSDQTNAFLALLDQSSWTTPSDTDLTFAPSGPTSLGELIGEAASTS
jgi:hypothetical protein